jgi:hypothetical protein
LIVVPTAFPLHGMLLFILIHHHILTWSHHILCLPFNYRLYYCYTKLKQHHQQPFKSIGIKLPCGTVRDWCIYLFSFVVTFSPETIMFYVSHSTTDCSTTHNPSSPLVSNCLMVSSCLVRHWCVLLDQLPGDLWAWLGSSSDGGVGLPFMYCVHHNNIHVWITHTAVWLETHCALYTALSKFCIYCCILMTTSPFFEHMFACPPHVSICLTHSWCLYWCYQMSYAIRTLKSIPTMLLVLSVMLVHSPCATQLLCPHLTLQEWEVLAIIRGTAWCSPHTISFLWHLPYWHILITFSLHVVPQHVFGEYFKLILFPTNSYR